MNQDSKPHNPFSLIADFDGDIRDLFAHRRDGELPILPLRNLVLFPGGRDHRDHRTRKFDGTHPSHHQSNRR